MSGLRRWAGAGALLGAAAATVVFAPAAWLAGWVARASGEQLLLAEARGTVWDGDARVVLGGGPGSRDARVLPGRLQWTLRWQGRELALRARQACCLNEAFELRVQPGVGRVSVRVMPVQGALMQWPAGWLTGLGAPWNSLELGGTVRVNTPGLRIDSVQGRVVFAGSAELMIDGLSSRLSLEPVLGSYRLGLEAQDESAGVASLTLSTRQGPLMLSGQGQLGGGQALRFRGQAHAETASREALNNLLNMIGRRQGAVSILSIG